jgi:hypothetical protein
MSLVLLDSRVFVSGADLSGSSNKIEVQEESEAVQVTNFRSGGAVENLAGLTETSVEGGGLWEAGDAGYVDDSFWTNRRAIEPWTFVPEDSDLAPGGVAYLTKALRTKMRLWGQLGEAASWEGSAKGTWPLARGVVLHASGVPRTTDGNGIALNFGAVASGRHLYANLHVIDIAGTAGPAVIVKVQSDSLEAFSSPTDRVTFDSLAAFGGQAVRVAGPVTDTWWRATWDVSGTNPSFLFIVSLGIE